MRRSALLETSAGAGISPGPFDSDSETLQSGESSTQYYPLFIVFARGLFSECVGPVDYEDVVQEAFLKFWLLYEKRPINCPKAYIRCIVSSVAIDMVRKYKPNLFQALPVDEDGEVREGYVLMMAGSDQDNPERFAIEREELEERLEELMSALHRLHARQQAAAVCHIRKEVDDVLTLLEALNRKGINSEWEWPTEPVEKQRLQASFSPARRNLARTMQVDLDDYE